MTVSLILMAGQRIGLSHGDLVLRESSLGLGHHNRLHHLAQHTVGGDDDGVSVFISQVKGLADHIDGFLDGVRSQNDGVIVAVGAAAGDLVIVGLTRLDGTDAGAAAHNIDDDHRQLYGAEQTDGLLHQRDTGRRGGDQHTTAGSGCAVGHVDGAQLRLSLDEGAAVLLQLSGHILGNLALRGDGVTEIVSAAGVDSSGSEGFVTLH